MTARPTRDIVALVDGDRVLTHDSNGSRGALPDIEPWSDLDEIATACGVAAVQPLGPPRRLGDGGPTIHVVAPAGPVSPRGGSWADLDHLASCGLPADAVAVILETLREHRGAAPFPARRPVWFRDGWLAEAERWIDDRVAAIGCRRAGATVLVRLWSLSAVLRTGIEGPGGARSVWFKATCDWFRAEAAITATLAAWCRPTCRPSSPATTTGRGS